MASFSRSQVAGFEVSAEGDNEQIFAEEDGVEPRPRERPIPLAPGAGSEPDHLPCAAEPVVEPGPFQVIRFSRGAEPTFTVNIRRFSQESISGWRRSRTRTLAGHLLFERSVETISTSPAMNVTTHDDYERELAERADERLERRINMVVTRDGSNSSDDNDRGREGNRTLPASLKDSLPHQQFHGQDERAHDHCRIAVVR